ncbi:MAG: DMT family transporter [Deltaproteobacteria bacterium]|nr:DMT family transporter [Deltaproteobacteria bacterium]
MKLQYWLLLIVAQTIWASSYVAMKISLSAMPYSMVIFLRYGTVALFFLGYWFITGFPRFTPKIVWGSLLIGFLNFYGSQFLQLHGLEKTQAIDVSILILFEPMLTVLMAYFILQERITKNLWIVLAISMLGFFVISDIHFQDRVLMWSKARVWGNLLFLSALIFEASCTVFGKVFTEENNAFNAMGLLMFFGGVGALLIHFPTVISFDYASISMRAWGALMFLAFGCSIFAYTAWYFAISKVRVQFVALSLFLQPIVGSLVGFLVLGEELSPRTFVGALIISIGLLWWQARRKAVLG